MRAPGDRTPPSRHLGNGIRRPGRVGDDEGRVSSETPDALARFSAPTRAWFTGAFAEPTPAQAGAWSAIRAGEHALVAAPTGSGKTLAAFLWALDRLMSEPVPENPAQRCRVLGYWLGHQPVEGPQ